MALFGDNWMRVFDIPETSKHSKGFTIYKIVSIVYPKNCPDAVTKVTVWKRYNDFKKLHRELKDRYKSMKFTEKYPTLISSSYFKRFDSEVINQRKNSALSFLEFVAQHPPLFKSIEFVKFFESSHTPQDALNSNINIIRAQLNLPSDPEISFLPYDQGENQDHSDSDTVSTFSSISTSAIKEDPSSPDPVLTPETKSTSNISLSKVSPHDSASSSTHSFQEHNYLSPELTTPDTPKSPVTPISPASDSLLLEYTDTAQYLAKAAVFITQATDCEFEKRYEEAFNAYKSGISCLLTGVKDDKDPKRRQMVRHKTEIYLLRAEKIYNIHLSPEMNQIRESIRRGDGGDIPQMTYSTKRPVSELFDYKVLKIIENGIVVLNKKEQNIFYMKVIEKSSQSNFYINIPKEVPYMVKLFQYYDCFHSIFIVTQYVSGDRLFDYIKKKSKTDNIIQYSKVTFERENDQDSGNFDEINSDSSECSYSDLILNYTTKHEASASTEDIKKSYPEIYTNKESDLTDSDQVISDDVFLKSSSSTGDLVGKSKQLVSSVSDSLLEQKVKDDKTALVDKSKVQRQFSEKSFTEEFSMVTYVSPLEDIVRWASQILLTLEKLHRSGIIVTDLNPRNLLLDDNKNILMTFMFNYQDTNKILCYNYEENFYVAPEVLTPLQITFAADWWSYGVILYELLTGLPLSSVHFEGITSHTLLKIPKYVSPEGKSLLRKLLVYEPRERLGCGINGTEDLKSHPFFNGVEWDRTLAAAME